MYSVFSSSVKQSFEYKAFSNKKPILYNSSFCASKDFIIKEKNIGLTDSMTPMEYISLMIKSFEEQKGELYKIGFLFEKALYSKDCLTQEEKNDYNESYNKFVGSTSTSR